MKKAIVNFKTRKNLKSHQQQEMTDFERSNSFGLIYSDSFGQQSELEEIIRILKSFGKKVEVMVFLPQPKRKSNDLLFFSGSDINFGGDIKNEQLKAFLDKTYDFALCLDQSGHFIIDYVFSLIKTKCRVGVNGDETIRDYDLMIHTSPNKTSLGREVIRYLKMIQNNEYQPI